MDKTPAHLIDNIVIEAVSDLENQLLISFKTVNNDLANIYMGACRIYRDKMNPNAYSLIAHSVREINKALPKYRAMTSFIESGKIETENPLEQIIRDIILKILSSENIPPLDTDKIYALAERWASYYRPIFREQLRQTIVNPQDTTKLPPVMLDAVDSVISTWFKLHDWFMRFVHHDHQGKRKGEADFEKKWLEIQLIWHKILRPFYLDMQMLDRLLSISSPNEEDLGNAISIIIRPQHIEYFFRNLDRPGWFDSLNAKGLILKIPEPDYQEKNIIKFPPWWPGYYLVKVADKIPKKIVAVLQDIKTDNQNAINVAMEATLNLPLEHAKQLLPKIDEWLNCKYSGLTDMHAIDLLGKFIQSNDYDGAFALFDILSKPIKDVRGDAKFRFEAYNYREDIIGKYLTTLIENNSQRVIAIIERHLTNATIIEIGDSKQDMSYIARPAIENHSQNHDFNEVRELFADILRDSMKELIKKNPTEGDLLVKRYLSEKYSIFRRLAIHIIRMCDLDQFLSDLFSSKVILDDYEIHHELMLLLRDKFGVLDLQHKKQIIDWILSGPDSEQENDQKKYWIARRLKMIKESIANEQELKDYLNTFREFEPLFDNLEHPEFLTYHSSWVGPTSPLDKETLKKMTPTELVHYLRVEYKPSKGHWETTPDGLGRILAGIVAENPAVYAEHANAFYWEGIYPAYIINLLLGLQEAWKNGKDFAWKPVLSLCETTMKIFAETQFVKEKIANEDDFGQYSGVRRAIADLLGEGLKKDAHILPDQFLPRAKSILFFIIENDPNPTPEDEKRFGGDNMDFVTYSINCTRGKAMEALLLYALRYARIHSDPEKEKGKGPFPPGERFEADVKNFLNKRLEMEASPSVHSVFGHFFIYLYYLDQEWIKKKLDENKILPQIVGREQFWEADWQGYVFFSQFSEKMFELLKTHYGLALHNLKNKDQEKHEPEDDRLAEHIMLAYLRELDDPDANHSLIKLFFQNASVGVRQHAVVFLKSIMGQAKMKKEIDEIWPRLKNLWERRSVEINDDELAEYIAWAKDVPDSENIETLADLIKKSIKSKFSHYNWHIYISYLLENVEQFPLTSIDILVVILRLRERMGFYVDPEDVRAIIEEAKKQPQCKSLVNEAVSILCELGYYDFRNLLVS